MLRDLDDYRREMDFLGSLPPSVGLTSDRPIREGPLVSELNAEIPAGFRKYLSKRSKLLDQIDPKKRLKRKTNWLGNNLGPRLRTPVPRCFPCPPAACEPPLDEEGMRLREEKLREELARKEELKARKEELRSKLLAELARLDEEEGPKVPPPVMRAWLLQENARCSRPASVVMHVFSPEVAGRLEQRARIEGALTDSDDFNDLMVGQTTDWERTLREWLLHDAELIAPGVVGRLSCPRQLAILETYLGGDGQATLGLIGIWLVGFRRALAARDSKALLWAEDNFAPLCSRHEDELLDTVQKLQVGTDNIAHFVDVFRSRYRNPLGHGTMTGRRTASEYASFCDLAYGTRSLSEWLAIGTNPRVYPPENFGWLSFLAFCKRTATGSQPDAAPPGI
jgi:hypothetical protein